MLCPVAPFLDYSDSFIPPLIVVVFKFEEVWRKGMLQHGDIFYDDCILVSTLCLVVLCYPRKELGLNVY